MSSTTPSIIHQMRTKLGRWRRNLQAAQLVQQGRALASQGDHTQALTAFKRAFDLNALTPLHVYECLGSTPTQSMAYSEQAEAQQLSGQEQQATENYALAIAHAGHYRESQDLDQLLQKVVVDNHVVITQFAINYFPMFEIWYRYFTQAGGKNLLVIALDPVVYHKVRELGIASYLLPVFNFQAGIRDILWLETVKFRHKLIQLGVDYIHTDIDAFWFANPLAIMRAQKADIVASIGYGTPLPVVDAWGFVLCLGFYQMRSTASTRKLYPSYIDYTGRYGHDQNGLNTLLLQQGTTWQKADNNLINGTCSKLDLQLTVLPDALISRQETIYGGPHKPMVIHPALEGKSMISKLAKLAQIGIK